MLSDRERRILARIERQLVESDPDLARMFSGEFRLTRSGSGVPTLMLIAGLMMLVTGSLLAIIPVALAGMAISVFALFMAHARPTEFGRPSIA